ncbi:MAG: hypothetical protein AAGC81_02170 [Pseudomonadota bacterium]
MIFFTIGSRNFSAQAQVLHSSLRDFYPDLKFYFVICDEIGSFDRNLFDFECIFVEEIGIQKIEDMQKKYNITELNTSIKPFAFNLINEIHPGEPIVYFDPDILIVSRLHELEEAIEAGANCVLTPHLLEPTEWAEMNETRILQFGAYNLGFIMLRGTPDVVRINTWWARRLEKDCVIDLERGLFVDQKWADLFPSFIDRTHVLRHPGYNVAYWNLAARSVTQQSDGTWSVNGAPLRFVHFSGSRISADPIFSRHSTQFKKGGLRDLDALFDQYVEQVITSGNEYYKRYPYSFNWDGAKCQNIHTPKPVEDEESISSTARVVDEVKPHLPFLELKATHRAHLASAEFAARALRRREIEEQGLRQHTDFGLVEGHCAVCGSSRGFREVPAAGEVKQGHLVDWSSRLICNGCGLDAKARGLIHFAFQQFSISESTRIAVDTVTDEALAVLRERCPELVRLQPAQLSIVAEDVIETKHPAAFAPHLNDKQSFDLLILTNASSTATSFENSEAQVAGRISPQGTIVFVPPFDSWTLAHTDYANPHPTGTGSDGMESPTGKDMTIREMQSKLLIHDAPPDESGSTQSSLPVLRHYAYWSKNFAYFGAQNFVSTLSFETQLP